MNREPDALSGTCDNEDLRIAVGALALGALDPDEAREVRQHLAGCPECQEEYASFVGVKRVMDIGLVGAPMPEVVAPERPRRSWRPAWLGAPTPAPFRAPRRRRVLTGAAGFAAAFTLIIGGFWAGHSGRPATASWDALPSVNQSGVTAQISYQEHAWGTSVSAQMSGTPSGLNCTLYVVDKNQAMVPLSNWRSVAGKTIDIPAATSLPAAQIDHFEVRVLGYGGYDITVPMSS